MPELTGTTRLLAVLGDPVTQVRAPSLLNLRLQSRGTDAALVALHVSPDGFARLVSELREVHNLDGLLVTVPHKAMALAVASAASDRARLAGSANALRRHADGGWYADTFDGEGFVRGLRAAGHDLVGKHTCIVGAGGAGSAIAVALLDAAVATVTIADTDPGRVSRLVLRLVRHYPGRLIGTISPSLDHIDIAINATPCGLRAADPLPFDPACLPGHGLVVDIIMSPERTSLLHAAERVGRPTHPGLPMLVHQIDSYLDFFRL